MIESFQHLHNSVLFSLPLYPILYLIEGDALREALKKQIEYYFSKENLMTDRYLVSQMTPENYVAIKTIANFKMIKSLTTDFDYLVSVMRECKAVSVDDAGTLVKPSYKPQRTTIILREIPSTTPVEVTNSIEDTVFPTALELLYKLSS